VNSASGRDGRRARRRLPGGAVWLLAFVFLPGFSCYELGPEPKLGPTLQAGYLPIVGLESDLDDVRPGSGFVLGGGVGTRRGGELVMPDEYARLASGEEELAELLRRYPRGYQMGGDFQDWAAGSSLSMSRHELRGTSDDADYWRLRIGGGGALNPRPERIALTASVGEGFHYLDCEKGEDVFGFGLYAGLGLSVFPAKNVGLGLDCSGDAWWGEGGKQVFTYVLGGFIVLQF